MKIPLIALVLFYGASAFARDIDYNCIISRNGTHYTEEVEILKATVDGPEVDVTLSIGETFTMQIWVQEMSTPGERTVLLYHFDATTSESGFPQKIFSVTADPSTLVSFGAWPSENTYLSFNCNKQ